MKLSRENVQAVIENAEKINGIGDRALVAKAIMHQIARPDQTDKAAGVFMFTPDGARRAIRSVSIYPDKWLCNCPDNGLSLGKYKICQHTIAARLVQEWHKANMKALVALLTKIHAHDLPFRLKVHHDYNDPIRNVKAYRIEADGHIWTPVEGELIEFDDAMFIAACLQANVAVRGATDREAGYEHIWRMCCVKHGDATLTESWLKAPYRGYEDEKARRERLSSMSREGLVWAPVSA